MIPRDPLSAAMHGLGAAVGGVSPTSPAPRNLATASVAQEIVRLRAF